MNEALRVTREVPDYQREQGPGGPERFSDDQETVIAFPNKPGNPDTGPLPLNPSEDFDTDDWEAEPRQSFLETAKVFGGKAKEFFNSMSERGKETASYIYEGIYATPGLNRLVGKMEIAYGQLLIDHHENKMVKLGNEIQTVDTNITAIEKSTAEVAAAMARLEALGAPGLEALKQKSIQLDNEKIDFLLKKEALADQRDIRMSKLEAYTGERDFIADRLIDTFDEKLRPVERRLESLETDKDILEQTIETTRAEHELQLQELGTLEQEQKNLEDVLRGAGLSERDVSRFETIKLIDEKIRNGREAIRAQEEKMKSDLNDINKQIVAAKEKAAPYQGHKREFEGLKKKGLYTQETSPTSTPPSEQQPSPSSSPEAVSRRKTIANLEQHIKEGSDGDEAVAEEATETLEALFINDPSTEEFIADLYTGGFNEDQLTLMAKHYFGKGRTIDFSLQALEIKPLILSLPNSGKKLQLQLSGKILTAEII